MTILNPNIEQEINNNLLRCQELFGGKVMQQKYLSTNNIELDNMLNGGYKKGLLTEINGSTDSGKTLLALQAVKKVQEENKIAIYIDTNLSLNTTMLEDNNINKDALLIVHLNIAEKIGPLLNELVKPNINDIGLIVIDNLANLTTDNERRSSLKANTDIHRSKVIKALLTRISNLVRNTDICVLIINQQRINIIDNNTSTIISSSERWVNMTCDTRIKLSTDENNDVYVETFFKEKKLK